MPNKIIKKTMKRGLNFSDEETFLLVGIWRSYFTSGKFKTHSRHDIIWQEIQEEHNMETVPAGNGVIQKFRYDRSWEELKAKINNLRTEFSKEKRRMQTDPSPSTWKYFDLMNSVLAPSDHFVDGKGEFCCVDETSRFIDVRKEIPTLPNDIFDDVRATDPNKSSRNNIGFTIISSENSNPRFPSPNIYASASEHDSSSSSAGPSIPSQQKKINGDRQETYTNAHRKRKTGNTDCEFLRQMVENDKKLLEIYEKRIKLDEEANSVQTKLLELEQAKFERDARHIEIRSNVMTAMMTFFNMQTAIAQQQLLTATASLSTANPVSMSSSTSSTVSRSVIPTSQQKKHRDTN